MIVICPRCAGRGNGCPSCGHAGTRNVSRLEAAVLRELARVRGLYRGERS